MINPFYLRIETIIDGNNKVLFHHVIFIRAWAIMRFFNDI